MCSASHSNVSIFLVHRIPMVGDEWHTYTTVPVSWDPLKEKELTAKSLLMLFFSSKTRNFKELWVSNCAKLRVHFPDPHFPRPHVLPKSSSWHWAPRLFLLPHVQWAKQPALEFCCSSNVLHSFRRSRNTSSRTAQSRGDRACLPRLLQLHCRPVGLICVLFWGTHSHLPTAL